MQELRLLKKYPNRRLYDTEISRYITLADVRQLVLEGIPFRVLDSRSGEETTRSVLLQILLEQEERGPAMFSPEVLLQFIRLSGRGLELRVSEKVGDVLGGLD